MSKKLKDQILKEAYKVSFDYKRPDGYWSCSIYDYVLVPVEHGMIEKNNHEKAADIIRKLYPECRINSVTYC
jgi:hypothetical protein